MWLTHTINSNAHIFGSKVALKESNRTISYKELIERTDALGEYFRSIGIKEGERVAILSKNSIEVIETFLSCYKSGLMFVPLNYRLPSDKLAYILNDCNASVLVVSKEYAQFTCEILKDINLKTIIVTKEPFPEMQFYDELVSKPTTPLNSNHFHDNTPAALIYTSGTTGFPKGVILTHRSLLETVKHFILELEIKPDDRTLNIMPLFHSGGHAWALAHICRGATGVVMPEFKAKEVIEVMSRESITTTHFVPTMIAMLLEEEMIKNCNFSSLKIILYAGSSMPLPILKKAMDIFGPLKLAQMYGQTEIGPVITHLSRQEHVLALEQEVDENTRGLLQSCGRPVFNMDVLIVQDGQEVQRGDIGEITVRGESMMYGYWNRPDLTEKKIIDGWVFTGDLGMMDKDGYVYIVDRKEDMIISGGENVYPAQVENIIYGHPAIAEVAVVGEPDEIWGERIVAAVSLLRNTVLTEEELIEWLRHRIEGYARPRRVHFFESLPKTASGKILRKEVRSKIQTG